MCKNYQEAKTCTGITLTYHNRMFKFQIQFLKHLRNLNTERTNFYCPHTQDLLEAECLIRLSGVYSNLVFTGKHLVTIHETQNRIKGIKMSFCHCITKDYSRTAFHVMHLDSVVNLKLDVIPKIVISVCG